MQTVHQVAAVPPQSFNGVLNLAVTIQPADLLDGLGLTARIR